MNRTRRAAAGTETALITGAAPVNSVVARKTRKRVVADPDHATFTRPLHGRPLEVEAVDGTRIHAEEFGPGGAPTIVLAHGWIEAMHIWARVIDDLAADLRVIAWDLRGHGRSVEPESGDHSIEAHAADLDAVLEAALGTDERAVPAGHSRCQGTTPGGPP